MIERVVEDSSEFMIAERLLSRDMAIKLHQELTDAADLLYFQSSPSFRTLAFYDIPSGKDKRSLLSGRVTYGADSNKLTGEMVLERPYAPGIQPCRLLGNELGIWELNGGPQLFGMDELAEFLSVNVSGDINQAYFRAHEREEKDMVLFGAFAQTLPALAPYSRQIENYVTSWPVVEGDDMFEMFVSIERRTVTGPKGTEAHEKTLTLQEVRTLEDGSSLRIVYELRIGDGFTSLVAFGISGDEMIVDLDDMPTERVVAELQKATGILLDDKLSLR